MGIPIEFHLDHLQIADDTENKVRAYIDRLEESRNDITGAFVSVKQLSGKPTVNEYEARIVFYHKPNNITGTSRSGSIPEALLGALNSTRRQLRKARSATRDRRKRATKAVLVQPELQPEPEHGSLHHG